MTTQDEQQEAARIAEAKKFFPKWKWIGVLSKSESRLRLVRIAWIGGFGPGWGAPDHYNAALSVGIEWKWQDLWVGAFPKGDRDEWVLWVCLLPCLPIRFHYRRAYGGWIMSPGPEPSIPHEHRRRWWQWIKVL